MWVAEQELRPGGLLVSLASRVSQMSVGGGLLLVATVIALVLSPQPASGHYLWHEDGDDTEGSLDLQGVRLLRRNEPNRGILRARTYENIDYGFAVQMELTIDSREGRRADRSVFLSFDGGSSGGICSVSNVKSGKGLGDCTFGLSRRLWRITFPWKLLDATKHIRWKVTSHSLSVDGPYDYAPDAGWFAH